MSGQLSLTDDWAIAMFLIVPLVGVTQIRVERRAFFLFALALGQLGKVRLI